MKKFILSFGAAALVTIALVTTAVAASPSPGPTATQVRDRDTIQAILGLNQAQIMELRRDGLSLAQIAERQGLDPQKLVDALKARWTERIEYRVTTGAISADRGTELKAQVELQARNMVYSTTAGGMRGAAVGAGAGGGAGLGVGGRVGPGPRGTGTGTGQCDGTGPHGAGRP